MKFVALLRGINVGGNNKVDMKRLKACLLADGLKTFLLTSTPEILSLKVRIH